MGASRWLVLSFCRFSGSLPAGSRPSTPGRFTGTRPESQSTGSQCRPRSQDRSSRYRPEFGDDSVTASGTVRLASPRQTCDESPAEPSACSRKRKPTNLPNTAPAASLRPSKDRIMAGQNHEKVVTVGSPLTHRAPGVRSILCSATGDTPQSRGIAANQTAQSNVHLRGGDNRRRTG